MYDFHIVFIYKNVLALPVVLILLRNMRVTVHFDTIGELHLRAKTWDNEYKGSLKKNVNNINILQLGT